MPEHKHASVLRAIADGVPLSEFEIVWLGYSKPTPLEHRPEWLIDEDVQIRRKSQHIIVNGFKVPKPLDADHKEMSVYVPRPDSPTYFDSYSEYGCHRVMTLGIAHATKEAAIAHAKAMLGIDPKWEE